MKRYAILLMITLALTAFTACSGKSTTPSDSEPPSATVSDSTSTLPSETPAVTSTEESAPISEIAESTASTQSASEETIQVPSETKKPQQSQSQAANNTASKPTDTAAETPKPKETSKPTEPPKPAEPVTPTEPPKPAFDVSVYVAYAKQYGQSIGLQYESSIGDGNWNAPTNLYSSLSDEKMKQNIRGACDLIKRDGAEYFYLNAEKQGDGSYKLYVYYG